MNQEVKKVLSERARYVLALTKKTEYSEESGRARDLIWVAPDRGKDKYNLPGTLTDFWQETQSTADLKIRNYNFYNVIIHELGHIFGVHHDESIARSISRLTYLIGGEDVIQLEKELETTW